MTDVVSYWSTPARAGAELRGRHEALVLAHVKGDETQRRDNASERVIDRYTGDRGGLTVRAGGEAGGRRRGAHPGRQGPRGGRGDRRTADPRPAGDRLRQRGRGAAAAGHRLIAIVGTFAELYVLGSVTDVSVFAINLTTALGLGLGIDYALLMVSRFREQLAAGRRRPRRRRGTRSRTAGRTITFSAATVAAALAALLVFPQYFLRSFAYAGIGVVAIAALSALLVMPALLAVLGHRVNSGPAARGRSGAAAPGAAVGPAGRARHAPARADRAAGAGRAAARGRPAARRRLRHAGRAGAAHERAEPAGRRRAARTTSPATTPSAVADRHDRPGGAGRPDARTPPSCPARRRRRASRPPPAPTSTGRSGRPDPADAALGRPTPSGSPWSAT